MGTASLRPATVVLTPHDAPEIVQNKHQLTIHASGKPQKIYQGCLKHESNKYVLTDDQYP